MTSLGEYFQTFDVEDIVVLDGKGIVSDEILELEIPCATNAGDTKNNLVENANVNVNTLAASSLEESQEQNNDCIIVSEPEVCLEGKEPMNDNILSRIGPFADNRPICDCELIQDLTSRAETRFLLSLLPDMAEMDSKQKAVFKQKIVQLISEVDQFDLLEDN